ncbi:acetyltransferase [Knoellia aerolata]|uniref:Acetyl transferase n=1 Tax=Knoellia aerolata DSM 18566 TaxID=1385519 RepID=A0A0A0JW30_9MICO|nr:acetyltransferase [Knoellia aerolata]KGN41403.1 acetyl transferase [Knoellia aerolata DSM 18566]
MPESARRVVVVGASGFGRECLDVLEAMVAAGVDLEVVGVFDDAPSPANRDRLGVRGVAHLGSLADFIAADDTSISYVLGVGHPQTRVTLVERLDTAGFTAFSAIHPSAVIGSDPSIGPGSVICAGAVVSTNVKLGRHVHLNPHVTIGHDAVLADFVSVNPGAVVSGEVTVGAATLVGASATILQGLLVREDAVIGAGAVVTRNVPNGVTVTGVPGSWS